MVGAVIIAGRMAVHLVLPPQLGRMPTAAVKLSGRVLQEDKGLEDVNCP